MKTGHICSSHWDSKKKRRRLQWILHEEEDVEDEEEGELLGRLEEDDVVE